MNLSPNKPNWCNSESAVEKRGWHWELTSFASNAWGGNWRENSV